MTNKQQQIINAFLETPPDGPPPGSREVRGQRKRRWYNGVLYESYADAWRAWFTDYLDTGKRLWWVSFCNDDGCITFRPTFIRTNEFSGKIQMDSFHVVGRLSIYYESLFTTFDAACEAAKAMINEHIICVRSGKGDD
jgi:hypothetical protein